MDVGIDPQAENEIRGLLAHGRKIEAIHVYREAKGCGLLEAKLAVDQIERLMSPPESDPRAQAHPPLDSHQPIEPKGCLGVLLLPLAAAAAVWIALTA